MGIEGARDFELATCEVSGRYSNCMPYMWDQLEILLTFLLSLKRLDIVALLTIKHIKKDTA
jgi:hypothetical protein